MERPVIKSKKSETTQSPERADGAAHARNGEVDNSAKATGKISPVWFIVLLVFMIVLIVAGALPRVLQQQALINQKKSELARAVSVSYEVAQASPSVQEFVLPGSTEAILTAPVFARVNGYLRVRKVNIGDMVHAGQLMAAIDTPEMDNQLQAADSAVAQAMANYENAQEAYMKTQADQRTAKANVQKAKSDLAFAKLETERYEELSKTGAVSTEDRDSKITNYKGATATLESMKEAETSAAAQVRAAASTIKVAKAAVDVAKSTREQVATLREFRLVKAPFDGAVTQANVDPGALITSGSNSTNTVLFNIAKTDVLRIYTYVPEQYISQIHVGQAATLEFQAFPSQKFIGTVTYVAGGLDPSSRTLQVEIHVPNPTGKLLPGMFAQVHFQGTSQLRLPVVPSTAVQFVADGSFVYTINDNNRAVLHKVTVARDLGGQVEILSGIAAGDKVIISPPDEVTDGAPVTPVLLTRPKNEK